MPLKGHCALERGANGGGPQTMVKDACAGALLAVRLERGSDAPLGSQLAKQLRALVVSGRLPAGLRLPSTRALAREFGVSRNTVLDAFEALAAEGYIEGRVGAGSYVAGRLPEDHLLVEQRPAVDRASSPVQRYPFRRLSARGRRLVDGTVSLPDDGPRAFTPDIPDVRNFPLKLWMRLMSEGAGRLHAGRVAAVTNAGYEPLRRAIATHLTIARGTRCHWQQVVITSGSQQSYDLLIRLLIDSGDAVWIPDPTYVGTRNALRSGGAAIYDVPCDGDGFPVEHAMATLPAPKLIVVAPSSQYPLHVSMPEPRRATLADFAARAGAWVIEDDYDGEFAYFGQHVPAVQAYDRADRVFFTGTFSKLLLPSFRLGYVVVPPDLVDDVTRARAQVDRHAPLMEQMALADFIERGHFASHVRRLRATSLQRQQCMIAAVQVATGARVRLAPTSVGTNLLLWLQAGRCDRAAAAAADELGVAARPLSLYARHPVRQSALILGYAGYSDAEIDAGIARLAPMLPAFAAPAPAIERRRAADRAPRCVGNERRRERLRA